MAPPRADRKKAKSDLRPDRKQFKKHRKEVAAEQGGDGEEQPQPGSAALLAAVADDADLPRGGRSLLSRDEVAEARAEAEADFDKEGRKGKRKRKGVESSGFHADDDLGTLFGGATTGKLPRFASITLKNISPNMKLWGVVIEVNQKDVVVGLPGGMRGFVRSEDVCDIALHENRKDSENSICAEVVHVGQLVPCIVLRVDDDKKEGKVNRRVWLSLRLSLLHKGLSLDVLQEGMVLAAQVKSIEDHGYILHFGVSSFSGFMQKSDKENAKVESKQLVQCVVKAIDKTRAIVHLSSDEDLVSKSIIKDLKGLSIDHLIPGMMISARVHSVLENGVMLSFLTYFSGTVDIFNLSNFFPSGSWKDDYSKNKKVNARILFVDPSTRAVGLTLNKHLLTLKMPPINVKAGDIYDNSKVLRIDKKAGLFIEIPSRAIKAIDKIRRAFLWKGRKDVKGGHCLVAWDKVRRPKELGGLGLSDLRNLGWALRMRWLWLQKTEPNRPWSTFPIQVHDCVRSFFDMAILSEVGDGMNTLFWKDRWLYGQRIMDLAPKLFAMVSKRTANKRTVLEALTNLTWIKDMQGPRTVSIMAEFLALWDLLEEIQLQPGVQDCHIWRLSSSGKYSAKSAYEGFFEGAVQFRPAERIWKTWAPGKYRFFLWLVAHDRCWTADRLARRGLQHPVRCPLCDQEEETINHLLVACVFARDFWFALLQRVGLQALAPQPDDIFFDNWWHNAAGRVDVQVRHGLNSLIILGAWSLWKHRNRCVFDGESPNVAVALGSARDELQMWCMAGARGLTSLTALE